MKPSFFSRNQLGLLLLFALWGCISTDDSNKDVYLSIVDQQDRGKIRISYTNDQKNTVCFSSGMWPNKGGKLDFASERVSLIIDGDSYPIKDFNTGYCPSCVVEVQPSETIEAYLLYEDFDLPDALHPRPKNLRFPLKTSTCE